MFSLLMVRSLVLFFSFYRKFDQTESGRTLPFLLIQTRETENFVLRHPGFIDLQDIKRGAISESAADPSFRAPLISCLLLFLCLIFPDHRYPPNSNTKSFIDFPAFIPFRICLAGLMILSALSYRGARNSSSPAERILSPSSAI